MNQLVDRVCSVINEHLSSSKDSDPQIIKLDRVFGKFALDVIYNVGFDIDRNFLHNDEQYQVRIVEMFNAKGQQFN